MTIVDTLIFNASLLVTRTFIFTLNYYSPLRFLSHCFAAYVHCHPEIRCRCSSGQLPGIDRHHVMSHFSILPPLLFLSYMLRTGRFSRAWKFADSFSSNSISEVVWNTMLMHCHVDDTIAAWPTT